VFGLRAAVVLKHPQEMPATNLAFGEGGVNTKSQSSAGPGVHPNIVYMTEFMQNEKHEYDDKLKLYVFVRVVQEVSGDRGIYF